MPVNQIRIPQIGSANYAPTNDGTAGTYPGNSTPVPTPGKANDIIGTGSNAVLVSASTPIPHPTKADGLDGSWSSVPFQNGLPSACTPIPHPGGTDDR